MQTDKITHIQFLREKLKSYLYILYLNKTLDSL